VKRWRFGGPSETPDSKGICRVRFAVTGRVAKANDITTIESGMATASAP
jgi:hypothetical protein